MIVYGMHHSFDKAEKGICLPITASGSSG